MKVTPWTASGGCNCGAALELPKSAIDSVEPTGDIHRCCGKALRVVNVQFADANSEVLKAAFSALTARAAAAHEAVHASTPTPDSYAPGGCYSVCLANTHDPKHCKSYCYPPYDAKRGPTSASYSSGGCYSTCLAHTHDPRHCRSYCYGDGSSVGDGYRPAPSNKVPIAARAALVPDVGKPAPLTEPQAITLDAARPAWLTGASPVTH